MNVDINGKQSIIMIIGAEITISVIKREVLIGSLWASECKSHQRNSARGYAAFVI